MRDEHLCVVLSVQEPLHWGRCFEGSGVNDETNLTFVLVLWDVMQLLPVLHIVSYQCLLNV